MDLTRGHVHEPRRVQELMKGLALSRRERSRMVWPWMCWRFRRLKPAEGRPRHTERVASSGQPDLRRDLRHGAHPALPLVGSASGASSSANFFGRRE